MKIVPYYSPVLSFYLKKWVIISKENIYPCSCSRCSGSPDVESPPDIDVQMIDVQRCSPDIHVPTDIQGSTDVQDGPPNVLEGPPESQEGPPDIHVPQYVQEDSPDIHDIPDVQEGPPDMYDSSDIHGPPDIQEGSLDVQILKRS